MLFSVVIMIKIQTGKCNEIKNLMDSCSKIAKQLGIVKKSVNSSDASWNGNVLSLNYKIKTVISNKPGNFEK